MKRSAILPLIILITVSIALTCGKKKSAEEKTTEELLAKTYDAVGIARISDVRLFAGQSLYEYIDGGAELYHLYGFVEVATADYRKNETEIVVDLYRFDSPADAYGLYSMLRPDDANIVRLGVEGYTTPSKIEFVKGNIMVRLIGYDDSDETGLALINLADELSKQLPGTTHLPKPFSVFPRQKAIDGSAKYYAESFLGQSFLTSVYSIDCENKNSRITLFTCNVEAGKKLLEWSRAADETGKLIDPPTELAYDDGKAIGVDDSFYGTIVVGLKANRMVGVIGYTEAQTDFINSWLDTLE